MAIQKRFIHFKKFSDFNSKKLSANEANTQYTVGVSGAIQDGEPDILYQSYVWIKDTKQQWTHAQLYGNDFTVDLTYEELKSLRDNAQLIPGQQYRITNYVTATTQAYTASAGHQFDIIVTADDEKTLNEVAKVCKSDFDIEKYKDAYSGTWGDYTIYRGTTVLNGKTYHQYETCDNGALQMLVDFNSKITVYEENESLEYRYRTRPSFIRTAISQGSTTYTEWSKGDTESIDFKYDIGEDTYFNDSNLAAWEIKYCIDNDNERFEWAIAADQDTHMFTPFTFKARGYTSNNDEHPIGNYETIRDTVLKASKHIIIDGEEVLALFGDRPQFGGIDEDWCYVYKGVTTVDNDMYDLWQKYNLNEKTYALSTGEAIHYVYGISDIIVENNQINLPSIELYKGIIYYMKDEFGNECPYDFKNILFDNCYTFHNPKGTDMSLTSAGVCHNNIIKPYTNGKKQLVLNDIVFLFDSHCYNNVCDLNCNGIHIGTNGTQCVIYDNYFHYSCEDINIDSPFICYNHFGFNNHNHTFQIQTLQNNRFGIGVHSIECICTTMRQVTIGDYSHDFDIRVSLDNTTIGNNTQYFYVCGGRGSYKNVTIGDCCDGVILDAGVYTRDQIKIGCHCSNITISDGSSIVIGNDSHDITLTGDLHSIGNGCSYIDFSNMGNSSGAIGNTVGDHCSAIGTNKQVIQHCVFGKSCSTINFTNNLSGTIKYVIFGDSVRQINISETRSDINCLFVASGNYNFQTYQNISDAIKKISIDDIVEVTYNELVQLRNSSQLVPGQKYRIIDYATTTSQKDTTSAGHQFDIIVTANSPSILSEHAKVDQNKNDAHFDDKNLNAWEIKYCIDNDTNRFAWAGDELVQTVKVEGVNSSNCTISVGYSYDEEEGLNKFDERIHFISQMWDDPANEAYLEGSAIDELITHWGYETDPNGIENCLTLYGLNLEFDEETGEITSEDGMSDDRWYYRGIVTVDDTDYDYWEKAEWGGDTGDFGYMDKQYSKKLFFLTDRIVSGEPTITTTTVETVIPLEPKGVIYYMKDEHGNEAPYDFKNIMFKYWVSSVDSNYAYTFSSVNNYTLIDSSLYPSCYNNKIDKYISNGLYKLPNNIFCNNNRIDTCYGNVLGLNCYNNEFGGSCYFNRFGDNCYDNLLYSGCAKNSFGNNCYNNKLSKNSTNNSFGVSCSYNRLGENALSNSFGNLCSYNAFGNYCQSNSFGNQCYHNNFYSKTPMSSLPANYVFHCHVDDGCKINTIVADNYNTTKKLKNLHIRRGVSDIDWMSQPLTLLDANYEITVAKNSKGEIKVYCEADLIS